MPSLNHQIKADMPFQQRGSHQQNSLLHTGVPRLDAFLGGFPSSTITLIDSNHPFSFELLSMLCVSALKTFGRTVVFVDGWISFDPYAIASLSKRSRLKADATLSKIMVARAFTAYQLDSIISDRLEAVIGKYDPTLLIISCVTDLLMDRTVREKEAVTILRRISSLIGEITGNRNLITILTKRSRPPSSRVLAFDDILYKDAGEIIKLTGKKKGIELRVINRDVIMDYLPLSIHQTTLDEFIGGVSSG